MVPYFGDFAEDDTVNIPFNTFDSNDPSASVTITNLADADIHVHKDGNVTEAVTDGATVVINFDGITGNHLITIDTSADAFYAVGSEYQVRIEGTTVDGATINAFVGCFSIERAGGTLALAKLIQAAVITNAAGADIAADIIAMKAETVLIVGDTSELQTDWANGGRLDLLLDAIPTTAMRGTDDAALASEVTAARMATLTDWINGGRLDLLLDAIPTTAMRGTDSALTDKAGFSLSATGLDAIAATATGMVNAAIAVWNRVLTGATHNITNSAGKRVRELQEVEGYAGGAVYIDTNTGTAGTEDFVNGTVNNPVDTIADAKTIADSVGLVNFVVRAGSSITLAQTFNNYGFLGVGATINMGSQDVGGCRFIGTNLQGIGTGASRIVIRECILTGAVSMDSATILDSNLSTSTLTLTAAAKYIFDGCFNGDKEGVSQIIDYTVGGLSTDVVFRHWSGCLDFRNMGQAGTDTLVIEGMGDVTFNVNCVGGTASLFGAFVLTDNSATVTITQVGELVSRVAAVQARADILSLQSSVNTIDGVVDATKVVVDNLDLGIIYGVAQTGTLSVTQATSDLTGFLDDELIGRVIIFTGGTADGQASRISDYASASGLITFDAITTAPANLDTFKLV